MRVLSIPGRRHAQNSYFSLLWDALEGAGVKMVSARTAGAVTFKYDILHVHFPEHLVTERPLYSAVIIGPLFLAYVAASKITGKKLVWTIHEVEPTHRHWMARPYLGCMRMFTNAYIFMNRTTEEAFFKRHPGERRKVISRIPHSAYPVTNIPAARYSDVRASLTKGIDCLLVGSLGEIRPYKNPSVLQYLPMTDSRGRPLHLVVAGVCHASCDATLLEGVFESIGSQRLVRIGERLSDERLSELVQSVDLVFMPYLRGWNSGFAMFVLACGGRLLFSALPMFREIAEALGPPWVYVFDHNAPDLKKELAAAISQISQEKPTASDRSRLQRFVAAHSFEQAASQHVDLYRNLLARPGVRLTEV
jgi:beta-1,4-mannosyltransferase